MSELIDRIPGRESLVGNLRGVVETTAQFKSRQLITGRSGQLGYAISSGQEWDLTETMSAPGPGYLSRTYRVTYTSDGSQKFPIVTPATDLRFNGVAEHNKPTSSHDGSLWTYEDGSCDVIINGYELPNQAFFDSESQQAWEFVIMYVGTVTLRIKAQGQASCDGTFAVTRVS